MKIALLLNHKAGSADRQLLESAAKEHLDTGPYNYQILVRESGFGRKKMTRQAIADGAQIVVAAGGDGTVSRVAQAIAGYRAANSDADITMGIVPMGTANLVARSLKIPLKVGEAVRQLTGATSIRSLDAMEVEGKLYFSHISLGTYSLIAKQESKAEKQLFGRLSYVARMLTEAARGAAFDFSIVADDRTRQFSASLVVIANVGAVGLGDMTWGEHIASDDGRIDACIVHASGLSEYAAIISQAAADRSDRAPAMEYMRSRRHIVITAPDDLPIRADGEIIGTGSVAVTVRAGVVDVVA